MKQILSVLAENKSGVLSKVTGLLRRKCFNIESLTAGRTCQNNISRMTIVIKGSQNEAKHAALQLEKLIEILSVRMYNKDNALVREIALARLKPHNNVEEKKLLIEVEKIFHKEIYRTNDEVCVELVDTTLGLDNFLDHIKSSGIEILEWARSGVIAIKDRR